MFHAEMRMSGQVVREFNMDDRTLWARFLAPLMADHDFVFEGHDFTPRKTRLKIFEGPELRPNQLGMGRGWQNVERSSKDVTIQVLEQARAHAGRSPGPAASAAAEAVSSEALSAAAAAVSSEALRERLIGRLSAGAASADEILAIATGLMPEADDRERLVAAQRAVWELLEAGDAQLLPSDR